MYTNLFLPFFMTILFNSNYSQTNAAENLREAMFYEKDSVRKTAYCKLCFRNCIIPEGKRGFCRNKENRKGILYNIVYAKPSAIQIDPVEKEPQLHMLPGTRILCFGTAGCNFRCSHCHNWHLSQRAIEEMEWTHTSPEEAVKMAVEKKIPTISFTYNEPSSFYEYAYDIAKLAKTKGLRILWHTNGSINPQPLKELLKYTDAVTVDLKGFSEKAYENSQASLEPVLSTLKIIKEKGIWLEIVNLVIPRINDSPEEIKKMAEWIKKNLGTEVPVHFSRFFPSYRMTGLFPTPIETLENAHRIAKEAGLEYVTIGNAPSHKYNSTFCPKCKKRIIYRIHFTVLKNNVKDGKCKFCGHKIPGIWK